MAPDQIADETRGTTIHRIEFDVEWPPGHAAAYLLDDEEPTLVDAGMPGDDNEAALRAALADAGYDPVDVDHVVLTHPHEDHVGLADVLQTAGDPAVYAPASYREALDRPLAEVETNIRETVRAAGIPEGFADRAVERGVEHVTEIHDLLPEEWVDVWMAGGECVQVGDRRFETVPTPGHQRDHLVLATTVGGERALFSGDMAIRPFRAAAVHANFHREQREGVTAYYESLDRLAALNVDRVYPGHGSIHEEYRAAVEQARESLDRLLDRTHDALRADGTHAVHVANERAEDITDGPWLPEAIAALAHLEREGRAESYREDGVRFYRPA